MSSKTKLKSKRSASKRFRFTAKGVKVRSANRSHILTKKAKGRKRQLRRGTHIAKVDQASIEQMLPI